MFIYDVQLQHDIEPRQQGGAEYGLWASAFDIKCPRNIYRAQNITNDKHFFDHCVIYFYIFSPMTTMWVMFNTYH